MARIRSLHPGQWTDEDFVACSPAARLLAIGLRNEADDGGVFEWKPTTLKMRILPADSIDVSALLAELVEHNQVMRFECGGKIYGAIRNFCKFQRPKKPVLVHEATDEVRRYVGMNSDEERVAALRREKWAAQNGCCAYCGTGISYYSKRGDSLELDHDIPLARGGHDEASNIVAACRSCNRSKGDMTGEEFMRRRREQPAKASDKVAKVDFRGPFASPNEELGPQMKEVGCSRKEEALSPHICPPSERPRAARAAPAFPVASRLRTEGGDYVYPDVFERLWRVYPVRREDQKKRCYELFRKAVVDRKADPEVILKAAAVWAASEGDNDYRFGLRSWLENSRYATQPQPRPLRPAGGRREPQTSCMQQIRDVAGGMVP